MIEKNQEFEVIIEGYGSGGEGVARKEGFVIFVPFALKDEQVFIHIIKVTKNYAVGKIINIIKASKERVDPVCEHFKKCGGCTLQHSSYANSLDIKKQIVEDALSKIGGFKNAIVKKVVSSHRCFNYRNKASFPIFVNDNNQIEVCMFKGLSHEPIFIDNCYIIDHDINKVAQLFKSYANEKFTLKDKQNLKHLVVRKTNNQTLITIVSLKHIKINKDMLNYFCLNLQLNENEIGFYLCVKKKDNNVILEGDIYHLFGLKQIQTTLLNVNIEISPMSFFQVNLHIMEKIYSRVVSYFNDSQVVLDIYSGAGLMSALLAKKVKQVYAVEIIEEATQDANKLKEKNNINNLTNINGDASIEAVKLSKQIKDFSLVLDPPRKGASKIVLDAIIEAGPKQIVYVSCNPASLARDLKILCEKGYKIMEVQPYDMFPQTAHVETLVYLEHI